MFFFLICSKYGKQYIIELLITYFEGFHVARQRKTCGRIDWSRKTPLSDVSVYLISLGEFKELTRPIFLTQNCSSFIFAATKTSFCWFVVEMCASRLQIEKFCLFADICCCSLFFFHSHSSAFSFVGNGSGWIASKRTLFS